MHLYERLGVRPLINAKGTYTLLSGSLMPPEVVAAMAEAARYYVNINELEAAVGARLAELTGAEAALVTGGCAAAQAQVAAACMAGTDPDKIRQLPDTTGLKHEIIMQRAHRNPYDQAFRLAGARIVEVETVAEFQAALTDRTCAVAHIMAFDSEGQIPFPQALELAHAAGLPLLVDAAAELPPAENLTRFVRMGADAVMFSGGKGLRGPQASGLLLGKRALIEAVALNACPNHSVGRPMKAGKEEIIGLLTAVELYLQRDHAAEWRHWESQLDYIADALATLPHVETGRVPEQWINHVPRLYVRWDETALRLTRAEAVEALRQGEPRIEVLETSLGLTISPNTLQLGEEEPIARRLREILGKGRAPA